jgi:hypothetical protein
MLCNRSLHNPQSPCCTRLCRLSIVNQNKDPAIRCKLSLRCSNGNHPQLPHQYASLTKLNDTHFMENPFTMYLSLK